MYLLLSCRTVEVNNTDAEGRLVLGDGVRSFLSLLSLFEGVPLQYFELFSPRTKLTEDSS